MSHSLNHQAVVLGFSAVLQIRWLVMVFYQYCSSKNSHKAPAVILCPEILSRKREKTVTWACMKEAPASILKYICFRKKVKVNLKPSEEYKWAINFLTTHPDLENIRGTGSCRNVKLVQHQYTDNVTSYATESFGQWRLCCISLNGWNCSK